METYIHIAWADSSNIRISEYPLVAVANRNRGYSFETIRISARGADTYK